MSNKQPGLANWFPEWTQKLARAHASGVFQMFIIHSNVSDIVRIEKKEKVTYSMPPEFLATQVFGQWDAVLYYDLVRGPRPIANTSDRLSSINRHIERFIGPVEELRATRDPEKVLSILDRYLELLLLREGDKPSVAIILDYAHFLVPSASVSHTSRQLASNLATLLNWAKSPYFKRVSFSFILISERLNDLHSSLVQNAHTTKIEIPYPDRDDRLKFLKWSAGGRDFNDLCEVNAPQLAELTAGLTLVSLQGLVQRAVRTGTHINMNDLKAYKKQMIEGQCNGLVEFIEPKHTLDLVVGHVEAKKRLREDAQLLMKGKLDGVPMGYLLCGPVGTGKTFLAECYAGSVGVPCIRLLNFRSKYVGETEGNLEKILKVLRVMGPVAVIIDEADAMLGDRTMEGDSGTSGRVFGQVAVQMGDTNYRGKIIWFLLTCRPDLLPIDLKRQGRCEVHIPLFYPQSPEEIMEMFVVMGRKSGVNIDPEEVPEITGKMKMSGADIEGIVNRAYRRSLLEGADDVTAEHLKGVLDNFIPAMNTDEQLLQTLAAILECTDVVYLPDDLRDKVTGEGRASLMKRLRDLKMTVD